MHFFINATYTTEHYTHSLHDALPILYARETTMSRSRNHTLNINSQSDRYGIQALPARRRRRQPSTPSAYTPARDRKSTRLNSSHSQISYAVFCLKKKRNEIRAIVRHR